MASLAGDPQRKLVLVGFMAAGKTRAAETLAEALAEAWADSDQELERAHGAVDGLFAERGEDGFRAVERDLVLELLASGPPILALGGGAVETPEVREALSAHVVIWRQVGLEEAWSRVQRGRGAERPLGRDRDVFAERFVRREPIYAALADAVLPEGDRELPLRAAPFLAALRELPALRLGWGRSASGEYPVFLGPGALTAGALGRAARRGPIGLEAGRAFCVTDIEVGSLYGGRLSELAGTIEIPAGERAKTLAEAERVLRELAQLGMTRHDHVLALGGGVVGDLAGFCAATYQRGVPVVQLPTTLVAQVDSAYGGKTGVDIPEAKNYVGAYHQPAAVLADTATLETLPEAELSAGFAEVIKTGLIAGGSLWERVCEAAPGAPPSDEVIFGCALTKLEVVAEDERDAGRRQVLNLGHTVGHAIEAATGYGRYRHGEAVGLGLLAALSLSGAAGLREEVSTLLAAHGLPTELAPEVDAGAVLAALERDKKRDADGVPFVLLERPGEPRTGQRVDADSVRAAVEELR